MTHQQVLDTTMQQTGRNIAAGSAPCNTPPAGSQPWPLSHRLSQQLPVKPAKQLQHVATGTMKHTTLCQNPGSREVLDVL
jgi:hypothetical protein